MREEGGGMRGRRKVGGRKERKKGERGKEEKNDG